MPRKLSLIGRRLEELRSKTRDKNGKPLSQKVFAKVLRISRQTYETWLKHRTPTAPALLLLKKTFGASTDWLLGDDVPMYTCQWVWGGDFSRALTEEVIRGGEEATGLSPQIRKALPALITPAAVMAELGRLARDLVQREQRLDERRRAFEIIVEAVKTGSLIGPSRSGPRPRNASAEPSAGDVMEAIAIYSDRARSLEAIAKPGSEDYFAACEHTDEIGRALRTGFAWGRRRGKAKPAARKPK